jgi:hypothetical protein
MKKQSKKVWRVKDKVDFADTNLRLVEQFKLFEGYFREP